VGQSCWILDIEFSILVMREVRDSSCFFLIEMKSSQALKQAPGCCWRWMDSRVDCQDWFFTDLISTGGLGVRGWSSGKTKVLHSVVALPQY